MAWYNSIKDLGGDLGNILTGHNPSNHPAPMAIPLGPGSAGPSGSGAMPLPNTGQQTLGSTEPVYPNFSIPGDETSNGIDLSSIISKIPGWVMDGLKTGLPAALSWLKDNSGSLIQGASLADAAYRQVQADKYAGQAIKTAQDAYDAKAPLRSAGIAGMLQAGAANPFAKGALPLASNPSNATPGAGLPFPPQAASWPKVPFTNLPFDPSQPVRDPRRAPSALPIAPAPAKGV